MDPHNFAADNTSIWFIKTELVCMPYVYGKVVILKFINTDLLILSLDRTDEEAKNQFLEEIELMKAIGTHKNVLSMLGCWVSSDPIFLVLEYVPYGDLLHWLRNKRIQVKVNMSKAIYQKRSGPLLFRLEHSRLSSKKNCKFSVNFISLDFSHQNQCCLVA